MADKLEIMTQKLKALKTDSESFSRIGWAGCWIGVVGSIVLVCILSILHGWDWKNIYFMAGCVFFVWMCLFLPFFVCMFCAGVYWILGHIHLMLVPKNGVCVSWKGAFLRAAILIVISLAMIGIVIWVATR